MPDAKNIIEVDARGDVCPVPMMKAVKAMKAATSQDIIEVWIDYAPALDTIPSQCNRLGWEFRVEQTTDDPEWKMTLTKKDG